MLVLRHTMLKREGAVVIPAILQENLSCPHSIPLICNLTID